MHILNSEYIVGISDNWFWNIYSHQAIAYSVIWLVNWRHLTVWNELVSYSHLWRHWSNMLKTKMGNSNILKRKQCCFRVNMSFVMYCLVRNTHRLVLGWYQMIPDAQKKWDISNSSYGLVWDDISFACLESFNSNLVLVRECLITKNIKSNSKIAVVTNVWLP